MVVNTLTSRALRRYRLAAWLLALPLFAPLPMTLSMALSIAPGVIPTAAAQAAEPAPTQPAPAEQRLSDAWLATLQGGQVRVPWSHAFALRHTTAGPLEAQRTRLINELDGLVMGARVADNAALAAGLDAWQSELQRVPALPGRTPGRHDLPWLGANLRQDPALSQLQHWGYCEVPSWIELWHLGGVSRLDWRSGMTLDQALSALPTDAYHAAEQAVIIAPNGKQVPRGIAAWNHQATPLSPGSRVVLMLPEGGGRSAALPASVRQEIAIVNERLPAYLATRLPGEACDVQEVTQ